MDDEQFQDEGSRAVGPDEEAAIWPDLASALDERPGPAASAENLRGILVRHGRRRRKITSAVAATVLAAGLGGGIAIGELAISSGGIAAVGQRAPFSPQIATPGTGLAPAPHASKASNRPVAPSSNGLRVVGGTQKSASTASGAAVNGSSAKGSAQAPSALCRDPAACQFFSGFTRLTKLFERTTSDGVTIRVFTTSYPIMYGGVYPPLAGGGGSSVGSSGTTSVTGSAASSTGSAGPASPPTPAPAPSGPPTARPPAAIHACFPSQQLLIEVSNAGAIGQIYVPAFSPTHGAISYVNDQVVGAAEGSPIAVLAVRVGTGVREVAARFGSGGYDAMEVSGGWAVLAASVPASPSALAHAAAANIEALGPTGHEVGHLTIPNAPAYAEPGLCVMPVIGVSGPHSTSTGTAPAGAPMIPASGSGKVQPTVATPTAPRQ